MNLSNDLESDLNTLVNEHGFTSVLESLKELAKTRVEDASVQPDDLKAQALTTIVSTLESLIEALPDELDIEIALEQLTHASADAQLNNAQLDIEGSLQEQLE